jgi:hypothetical protein
VSSGDHGNAAQRAERMREKREARKPGHVDKYQRYDGAGAQAGPEEPSGAVGTDALRALRERFGPEHERR